MPGKIELRDSLPEINAILQTLDQGICHILGDSYLGLYLYGSLASGNFDPQTSDIDFMVLTNGVLPGEVITRLERFHHDLESSGQSWADKLEGIYLPLPWLRRYNPQNGACPTVNEGRFYLAKQGMDWVIQRHILRESGIVMRGPELQDLIDPVSPGELRQAVQAYLDEWWAPMLLNPGRLADSHYQSYAILSMCRVLYTLENGIISSKPVAARWAIQYLDSPWKELVERALSWLPGMDLACFEQAQSFIQFTLNRARSYN